MRCDNFNDVSVHPGREFIGTDLRGVQMRIPCDHCGSTNTKEIKREPVTVGRLTDHKITYHCNACGKETVKGDVKE
jgi:hypothetical protein